jgi:hypothetical protein
VSLRRVEYRGIAVAAITIALVSSLFLAFVFLTEWCETERAVAATCACGPEGPKRGRQNSGGLFLPALRLETGGEAECTTRA